MFRYLIVCSDPSSASDTADLDAIRRQLRVSPSAWQASLSRPGMLCAHVETGLRTGRAIRLDDENGIIFGKLYLTSRRSGDRLASGLQSLSPDQSMRIIRSGGRSMVADYWGHYVVALYYPERPSSVILRSPMSPLSCFHLRRGSLNVFFSHLEDCTALRLSALSINWDSINAQVIGGDYLTNETAINEIRTLECGESIECARDQCVNRVYWNPQRILNHDPIESFSEATHAIRSAVEESVNTLATEHDAILVSLSGGLDSSIILGVLGRSSRRPSISAVNYYSRGCGDERDYARSMAAASSCRLVEYARDGDLDLHCFEHCNLTVRPILNFSAPDIEKRSACLAREHNASAIFDGELGDNIFGRRPGAGVLIDCVRRTGFGPKFVEVLIDYARLNNLSVWRTLHLMYKEQKRLGESQQFDALQQLRERYGVGDSRSMLLATLDAEEHHMTMGDRFLHPWLKGARSVSPGSQTLLFGLVTGTSPSYHSPFGGPSDPPHVSPFVNQRLVEAALRIPSYFNCHGAQDRAVARAAFLDILPTVILNRGSGKSGPDLWAKEVVEKNYRFLRDFLLDGFLVQHGLVDRKKLELALSPRIAKSSTMVGELLAKLYIEAWLKGFNRIKDLAR